jgi:type II secretory pathway pseudopilin PulG
MIVILIIGLLLAMAIPNWLNTRENSRQKACINNLTEISDAKDIWAADTKAVDGATPTSTDLAPTYIKVFPICPASGSYTINTLGVAPTCSYTTGQWPHILNNGG